MERPRYVLIGGFIVAAVLAFSAAFGLTVLPGIRGVVWGGLLVLGGVSFVLGGWWEAVTIGSRELAWWRFVGLANALIGLALVFAYLPDVLGTASTERFLLGLVAIGGGVLVFAIGVDTARGGKYVDLHGM